MSSSETPGVQSRWAVPPPREDRVEGGRQVMPRGSRESDMRSRIAIGLGGLAVVCLAPAAAAQNGDIPRTPSGHPRSVRHLRRLDADPDAASHRVWREAVPDRRGSRRDRGAGAAAEHRPAAGQRPQPRRTAGRWRRVAGRPRATSVAITPPGSTAATGRSRSTASGAPPSLSTRPTADIRHRPQSVLPPGRLLLPPGVRIPAARKRRHGVLARGRARRRRAL